MWQIQALKSFIQLFGLTLMLILLHWLRRLFGNIPMFLLAGLLFVLAQNSFFPGFTGAFDVSGGGILAHGALLLPVLVLYFVLYEDEGTLEAQRFLFGLFIAVAGFFCITQILLSRLQSEANVNSETITLVGRFFAPNRMFFLLLLSTILIVLFLLLAVNYQWMRNMHYPLPVAICILAQMVVFFAVCLGLQSLLPSLSPHQIPPEVWLTWLSLASATSLLADFYLRLTGKGTFEQRRTFGMLSTLLGNLQTASQLRQRTEEWAGRYNAVFDNSQDMIFLVRQDGVIVNANRSAVKTLVPLRNGQELNLAECIFTQARKPLDWTGTWELLWGESHDEPCAPFEDMILRRPIDNDERNIQFTLAPAGVSDMPMAVCIMRDTTRQHQEASRRHALEEQLLHSQRMEAVGLLAGGIAHDFNNLLQGIQSSVDSLARQQLSGAGRAMLGTIDDAIHRAAELINKLLGFARKGKYQEEIQDLGGVARKTADLFIAGLKNVDFRFLTPPDPVMVKGDSTQLQQIILNLLFNARDALPQGDLSTRRITLKLGQVVSDMPQWKKSPAPNGRAADYVFLSVKDSGKGMSREVQEKIFQPFFTTKGVNGTGLGLAMVYGCVEHHHGWIVIDSQEGEGSEFTVFLPSAKTTGTVWKF